MENIEGPNVNPLPEMSGKKITEKDGEVIKAVRTLLKELGELKFPVVDSKNLKKKDIRKLGQYEEKINTIVNKVKQFMYGPEEGKKG